MANYETGEIRGLILSKQIQDINRMLTEYDFACKTMAYQNVGL